ncbi:MAG TPA: DUF2815 family protein [Candidatus Limousia pullorum]|uniref:DUF2815 family protein n=1 Tax=Candidatus Limousia pullorum TaxID=2840860 RepID=A0A9D1LYK7_9FIRM|nr:DUF2815 family protein [Candidatus Limousia pullorum]
MYQNIATKVLTGEVRLSYVHLTTPKVPQSGGTPKYSVTLLIPKSDNATKLDIEASIKAAYAEGVNKKWGGAHPQPKNILHDGDGLRPSGLPFGEECKGHWVITASTQNKPQVVGIDNINCELAPQDIYSGMYARVTVNFFPYDNAGSKGVACGLGNVMKTRDGEPLSGGASAASDFAAFNSQPTVTQPAAYYNNMPPQAVQPAYNTPQTAQPMYGMPQQYNQSQYTQQGFRVNPITGEVIG